MYYLSSYSIYSYPKGVLKVEELVMSAHKLNINKLAITDQNTISSWDLFLKETHEKRISPILGIDINMRKNRYYILAKNKDGINDIYQLYQDKHLLSEVPFYSMLSDCYIIYPVNTLISHKINLSFNEYVGFYMHDLLIGNFDLLDFPINKTVFLSDIAYDIDAQYHKLLSLQNKREKMHSILHGNLLISEKAIDHILYQYQPILENTKKLSSAIVY